MPAYSLPKRTKKPCHEKIIDPINPPKSAIFNPKDWRAL
jgi:hypothetical protein